MFYVLLVLLVLLFNNKREEMLKMMFVLRKMIDGEWYVQGRYTEHNIETLCRAYGEVSRYAEDVKVDVITGESEE